MGALGKWVPDRYPRWRAATPEEIREAEIAYAREQIATWQKRLGELETPTDQGANNA